MTKDGDAKRRGDCGEPGEQDRVRPNRQWPEHEDVTLTGKHRPQLSTANRPTTSIVVAIRKCSTLYANVSRPYAVALAVPRLKPERRSTR